MSDASAMDLAHEFTRCLVADAEKKYLDPETEQQFQKKLKKEAGNEFVSNDVEPEPWEEERPERK